MAYHINFHFRRLCFYFTQKTSASAETGPERKFDKGSIVVLKIQNQLFSAFCGSKISKIWFLIGSKIGEALNLVYSKVKSG